MSASIHAPRPAALVQHALAAPARREPRQRDFGIGYGRSSGYVSQRRYAGSGQSMRFRIG